MEDKFSGMVAGYISGCEGKRSLCRNFDPLSLLSNNKIWLLEPILNGEMKSFRDYIVFATNRACSFCDMDKLEHMCSKHNSIKHAIYSSMFDTLVDNNTLEPSLDHKIQHTINLDICMEYWIHRAFLLFYSGNSIINIFRILRLNKVDKEKICFIGALLGCYLGYDNLSKDGVVLSSDNLMFASKKYVKYVTHYQK
jgi:hypothetical protein